MRTKMLIAVLAVLALFATAAAVMAAEGGGMRKGDISVGANVTNTTQSGGGGASTTITTLMLTPGYFVTPEHEVGANVLLMGVSGSATATITFIRPSYSYHFLQVSPVLIPYLGAQVGSISINAGGTTTSATSYGPHLGVDYFLKENAAANLDYTYDTYSVSGQTSNSGTLSLGYKFFF